MKKLIIALCGVLAVGAVNAATASWAVSNITDPASKTGEKLSGGAAYLFASAVAGNALSYGQSGAEVVALASVLSAIESGTFATDYASKAYAKGSTSATGGLTGQFATGFVKDDSLTAFIIVFDDADVSQAENYMLVTSSASTTKGQTEIQKTWTSGTGGQTFSFASQADTSWHAIPEPTSGLLLLLGVAGLALRRRRA